MPRITHCKYYNTMKKSLSLSIGLMSLAVVAPASAAGLIGENYAQAEIGYATIDISGISNPDGWTAGGTLNHAAVADPEFGIDVGAALLYHRVSGGGIRTRGTDFDVYGKVYMPVDVMKPYLGANTGWSWDRTRTAGMSFSDNTWTFGFSGGVEFALTDTLSLTPDVSWKRYEDYSDDVWVFGVTAHNWFTETTGGSLGYSVSEGPNRAHQVTVGVSMLY